MMSNVKKVVSFLATQPRDGIGEAWTYPKNFQDETQLNSHEINDAIDIAERRGWVEVKESPPNPQTWKFTQVTITALGRLWLEGKK